MAHPLAEVPNFTYNALNKELELSPTEKAAEVLLQAYLEDFWQKGAGSLLPPAKGAHSTQVDGLFEKRFVFRNVISEVVGRVVGAFFGKAPNWKFAVGGEEQARPTPGQTAEAQNEQEQANKDLEEIDKALGEFFTSQNVAEELGKAFALRLAFGRGCWRIYLPTKYKRKNRVAANPNPAAPNTGEPGTEEKPEGDNKDLVKFASIPDAIRAMRIEFVPPGQGRLLDDGGELFSICKYKVRRNWETQDAENVIEFSFVDNSDLTFLGTVSERGKGTTLEDANLSTGFDLGGLTTLGQFQGRPYVTHALYKNNQLVNLALTCAGFSLVDNGFGEMVLTNVELATRKVTGPEGSQIDVPVDIKRGGGVINNFVGLEQVDDNGSVSRVSPGVTFREPTAITPFRDGYDLGYIACLQEAGQMYALISGDATASGESRVQALADFVLKISPYKPEVDEQGSAVMTVVALLAAELAGQPLPDFAVIYDSRMHVAALSTEEKNIVMQMREKGVISRETERVLLGVDDPALENQLILREQATPPEQTTTDELSARADLCLKLLGLNIDPQTVQKLLGFTDAQIAEIQQRAAEQQAEIEASIARATAAGGGNPGGGDNAPDDLGAVA